MGSHKGRLDEESYDGFFSRYSFNNFHRESQEENVWE